MAHDGHPDRPHEAVDIVVLRGHGPACYWAALCAAAGATPWAPGAWDWWAGGGGELGACADVRTKNEAF